MTHDDHCADAETRRAVVAAYRAVLNGDPEAAALATLTAPCPVCLTVSAVQFGFALATSVAGEAFVSESLRRRFASAVDAAERELGAA